MNSICGENCNECGLKDKCRGCCQTCGNPFGDGCIAAEYINLGGKESFEQFKETLMSEINKLNIPGMPKVNELYLLAGFYVNMSYPTPSGEDVKFLNDNRIYLGAQLPCEFDDMSGNERCFGIVADKGFILVAEYGDQGSMPEIVLFKRR